ncbi:hypothetical protein UA08_07137 [Talaromyces atroroseus]|uniref:RRM domain-containing protein n=1 Tax=Talaromyces atroroseus TaxID=1441469 RepID=A0A225ARI4_TALAT|nr:hypothetical protein UA08_07137 [Talaromyces atroroseus]OKL57556.1 hypothetical protein UA08_07137 [Talaromyces atroroseus]
MSSKLDQSLEDISKSRRQSGRGNNGRRSSAAKATAPKAPIGGIKKSTKPARGPAKGTAIGPTSPVNESKIIVSGLPHDVSEASIKRDGLLEMRLVAGVELCRVKRDENRGACVGLADLPVISLADGAGGG